jgi:hypothetical protein
MKNLICILAIVFFTVNVNIAQSKSAADLKLSLDCANANNELKLKNVANCSEIILTGSDAENYTFIFGVMSINQGGILKQFAIPGKEISEHVKVIISKMIIGEKLFIENAKVKNNTSGIIKTLPVTKITIK